MLPDNRDAADVLEWEPAKIMRQAKFRVIKLALVCPAMQLKIHFIEHPQARCADGMAEAFKAAVNLAGDFTIAIIKSVHTVFNCFSAFRNM